MPKYDTIIKDGMIVDGTRMPRFRGDVAIKNGVIARVGLPNGQKIDEGVAEIRIGSTTEAVIVGALPGTLKPQALVRFAKAAEHRAKAGLHS